MIGNQPSQQDQEAFNRLLIALLENLNLPYAIGGSLAAMSYSETRFTIDIDLMFEGGQAQIAELIEAVESLQIYIDPLDTVLEFNLPKQMPINVLDGSYGTRAALYVARPYGLDQSAMSRRGERLMYDHPVLNAWYLRQRM